jgi:nucleoid-associated protein YgaU
MSMPAPPGNQASASLSEETSGKQVVFQFNPEKITVSHQGDAPQDFTSPAQTTDKEHAPNNTGAGGGDSTPKATAASRVSKVKPTTISIGGLIFSGAGTVADCAQLLDWSIPSIPPGDAKNTQMPTLTFKWGTLTYKVILTSVKITYERFTSAGTPVRATADLGFTSTLDPPTATNPTSGGLAGRRGHIMVAGENLQHIATANYGKPGAWRALAAANGIEDPLAVQPGTLIYLPAAAELGDRAAR